jgi:hypothetical protein
MSLNHIVFGGSPYTLDARFKNLTVDGEITSSSLSGQKFEPNTGYLSPGSITPGEVTAPTLQYIQKIGKIYHMHTLASYTTGIGSTSVELSFQLPDNINFGTLAGCIASGEAQRDVGGVIKKMVPKNFLINNDELKIELFAPDGITYSGNDEYRYTGMLSFENTSSS